MHSYKSSEFERTKGDPRNDQGRAAHVERIQRSADLKGIADRREKDVVHNASWCKR